MAELTQQQLQNGQELQTGDVNNLGLNALSDDRVLAEILRLLPDTGGTISRCILPYGVDNDSSNGTVAPSGSADGSVHIYPFRAVIGSRTLNSVDGLKSWRDIRSGVCVANKGVWSPAASPATALFTSQLIAANSSGNARWDLIYAVIQPDANQTSVQRAVKSASTGVVTTPGTVVQLASPVSIGYLQGTPAASPQLPAVPSDSGGSYYIPLAYVMVPIGFGAGSTVKSWMIMSQTPAPIALSKGLGGANAAPANQANIAGGQVVQSTSVASWANNSTTSISARPNVFMPPSMVGMECIFGGFDLTGGSSANWSHQNFSTVDSSRDWRNRIFLCFWQAQVPTSSGGHFAWDRGSSSVAFVPEWQPGGIEGAMAGNIYMCFGQSFILDAGNFPVPGPAPTNSSAVAGVGPTGLTDMGATSFVGLYVDNSDSGKLKIYIKNTATNCLLFFWLFATRAYHNY